jgi:hypothetical protein
MIFFESCVYVVIMSSMRMSPFERQKPPSKKAISSAEAKLWSRKQRVRQVGLEENDSFRHRSFESAISPLLS